MYLRLVYKNGDKYNKACKGAERTSVIAILCNYYNVIKKLLKPASLFETKLNLKNLI